MTTESNSSIAALHNIICKRGDTFSRVFTFFTDSTKTIPLDITASTFKLSVKNSLNVIILEFTEPTSITLSSTNILTFHKSEIEMSIGAGSYKYDLQKTLSNGNILTIIKGTFTIQDDVTTWTK